MSDIKVLKVTEDNFIDLLTGAKTFDVREKSIGVKYGDTVVIEEYNEVTDQQTYRLATAEIGVTQVVGEFLVMSIDVVNYVDEKGILHYLTD